MIDLKIVLPTLERFLAHQNLQLNDDIRNKAEECEIDNVSSTLSRLVVVNDINIFWRSYHPNFSKQKKIVWAALDSNLNKYLLVKCSKFKEERKNNYWFYS